MPGPRGAGKAPFLPRELFPCTTQELPHVSEAQPFEGFIESAPDPFAALLGGAGLAYQLREEVIDASPDAEESVLHHAGATQGFADHAALFQSLPQCSGLRGFSPLDMALGKDPIL